MHTPLLFLSLINLASRISWNLFFSRFHRTMEQSPIKEFLGAEARLILMPDVVIKTRLSKGYRISEIDSKLIKRRTKSEAKMLKTTEALGLNTPRLLEWSGTTIRMERIPGNPLKDSLEEKGRSSLMKRAGKLVRKIHNAGIIHGDLTTLNFIVNNKKVYLIDFGLSFISHRSEDKAVDLHAFEKTLRCPHRKRLIKSFYEGYSQGYDECDILERLKLVRLRGRKRE